MASDRAFARRNRISQGWQVVLLSMLACSSVQAGLFRLESETLMSARNDDDLKFELPSYELLSANYINSDSSLECNSDMSLFADPVQARNRLNVHLLNFSYEAIPDSVRVTGGRMFGMQNSLRSTTLDSLGLDMFYLRKRLRVGAFAGRERRLELAEWNPSASVIGGSASYLSDSLHPLNARLKLVHRTFDSASSKSESPLEGAVSREFEGAWSPEVLVDAEMDASSGMLNRAAAGVNLSPSLRSTLRWRAETYDLAPTAGIEKPIFRIFSQGRLYETSVQSEYQLSRGLIGALTVAYDNYLLQEGDRTDGLKLEGDIFIKGRYAHLEDSVYYLSSYGGWLVGNRAVVGWKFRDGMELIQALDVAYYEKVTSSKRVAFNSITEFQTDLSRRLKLSVGGEYNSTNVLTYDVRAFAALKYLLWVEI
jgi:hypothetical protein